MSGGSWDYLCYKVADAANQLCHSKCPYRKAFGEHLRNISEALHDIEWVDSCDKSPGDEIENIMKCIEIKEVLDYSISHAKETLIDLKKLIDKYENK